MDVQDLIELDEESILTIINDDTIDVNIKSYQFCNIVEGMSDSGKQQILHNKKLIEKYKLNNYDLENIIISMTEKNKIDVLMDNELLKNQLQISDYTIVKLAKDLSSEEVKDKLIDLYQFSGFEKMELLETYSDSRKINPIINDKSLRKFEIISILESFNNENFCNFLEEHKDFLNDNQIDPYEIVKKMDKEKQIYLVSKLDGINLTLNEKKEILATLSEETKKEIDISNFSEEYKSAINLQTSEFGEITYLDFERNMMDYQGLDKLIIINPEKFTKAQKNKFSELCDICPNLKVASILKDDVMFYSKGKEYNEAEKWIDSVINRLNPEYSKLQKMAIIDNAIGKKISYSPDFETEVFDNGDSRALWKIISSGYGVCNGIARVEQYMLDKIGVESEIISGDKHAFLKVKDIEIPLSNDKIVKGNTIIDPTWNLTEHRFGGKPDNFCISYEQARKNDIDKEGKDHICHKNDEQLKDANLNLDEENLIKLFSSVGLADKEGKFLIKDVMEMSKLLDEFYANEPDTNINKQFSLLKKVCPEFAKCQNSSMTILSDILLNNKNLKFNKCNINRVYSREDNEKKPIMYVHINSDELGNKFYYANKEKGQFIELPQEEFVKQFECYEQDLEKYNGLRPWEIKEQEQENVDLSKSAGKIVAEEGR